MHTNLTFIIAAVVIGSLLLTVLEPALVRLLDAISGFLTGWIERLAGNDRGDRGAIQTALDWLSSQAKRIIDVTSKEDGFWGTALVAAVWNATLFVAFLLAEYGLAVLSLRSAGFVEGTVLPLGAGPLTVLGFLASSAFFIETLLELTRITRSGRWDNATGHVRQCLIVSVVLCLAMVLAAGAILALIRGSVVATGGADILSSKRDILIPAATVMMSVAVFVALGLSAWAVKTSVLHLYGIGALVAHGVLAGVRLALHLLRLMTERFFALLKAVLAVPTEPWKRLFDWLARYATVRKLFKVGVTPFADSAGPAPVGARTNGAAHTPV